MRMTKPPEYQDTYLGRDLLRAARYYLGGRRGFIALAAIALVAGFALNWSWLVAAGVAPLLLGVLPCVAMCALGICMSKMGGKSCSNDSVSENSAALADEKRASAALDHRPINPLANTTTQIPSEIVSAVNQQAQSAEERSKTDA